MRIEFLDNLTGKWAKQWTMSWFIFGAIALSTGFWLTTEHTTLDWFYLAVSVVGLICVVSLAFRKNVTGNGVGIFVTAGEVAVHTTAGSTGLILAPLFNCLTHIYGFFYWSKNTDDKGNMVPKSATKWVIIGTLAFIGVGLLLFPVINDLLAQYGFAVVEQDDAKLFGMFSFYWVNVVAFILAITAQVTMILRFRFNWWIWIVYNFVGLAVNLMAHNYIFAIQTMVYQINACIGLYEWYRSTDE